MKLVLVLFVCGAALLPVACGGSGGSPEGTVKTYLNALADGNGKKACDQLTGQAQRDALDYVSSNIPELNATSCEGAMGAIADNLGGDEKSTLRKAKLHAKTTGNTATVSVEGGTSDAQLKKVDGRWYISGGLFDS